MSLDALKPKNIAITNPSLLEGGSDVTSAKINVPIGQGTELGAPVDTLNANNITSIQTQTVRSKQQLLDSLKFLQNYGITQTEGIEILCTMGFNCSEQSLLKLDQKSLNNKIKIIMDTITALQEDKIEVNKENLKYHAGKYAAQIDCGHASVASFRSKPHESITDKLKRSYGNKFLTGKPEDLAKGIEAYYTEIKGATDIADFSKLLHYSNPEEIIALYNAIPYLEKNDKLKGVVVAIKSCSTPDIRSKLVSNYDVNQKILTSIDKNGNFYSKEEMEEISTGLATYRTYEDALEYNNTTVKKTKEFFAQDKIQEKIKNIQLKKDNNETLTKEEQELLNLYNSIIAEPTGQFIGYSNSNVLSKEEKKLVTSDLNKGIYETPIYREVIQSVNEYIEKHYEDLTITKDEFIKLMDEATSGNYTKVVNDIANGTTTELSAPAPKAEVPVATHIEKTTEIADTSSIDPRYKPSTTNIDALKPHTLTAQLYSPQKQDNVTPEPKEEEPVLTSASTMDDYYKAYNGGKGFKKIRDKFGTIATIKYILNKQAQDTSAMLSAVSTFKGLDCSQQFNTIKGLYSGLTVALDNAKESTMERLQGVTLRTFGATKLAREAAEERLSS